MKKGFTLIELLIVVVIIGILLAVIIPRIGITIDKARERACRKNLHSIQAAITTYCVRLNEEVYPNTVDEFEAILLKYFPQKIPVATLRKGVANSDSNSLAIGVSSTCITDNGGWLLVTDVNSQDAGRIFINSREKDLDGIYYSSY
ncbi:TPA: hypothetical protein DCX16_00215 [bacterium]|nr:hypothetical protein [bacterium]